MRMIDVSPNADLNINVGTLWLQFGTDVGNPNYLIQIASGGSAEINSNKDMVILADAELTGQIPYVVRNTGNLSLDGQRIFLGVENHDSSLGGTELNRLIANSGSLNIGSDKTELIALNGGRVGILLELEADQFGLQTKKLQLLGDDHPDSRGIYIESDSYKSDGFIAQEAYIGKVGTGIIVNGGKADMKFERLWNEAFAKSVFLNDGKLTLEVGDSAHFGKEIDVGYGDLVLNGGQYEINNRVYVCMYVCLFV